MPTYEYKCDACGTTFEKFQSITSAPVRKCPHCGKSKVRRLISGGAGLIFKGSGFYITDYRSDSYKSDAKAESGAKPAETAAATAGSNAAAASRNTTPDSKGAASSKGSESPGKSSSTKDPSPAAPPPAKSPPKPAAPTRR